MVAIITTEVGEFVSSAALTTAVERCAVRWAGLVTAFLAAYRAKDDAWQKLPQHILADLGAVLDVWCSEQDGLSDVFRAAGLPSAGELAEEFLGQARVSGRNVCGSPNAIHKQVLRAWLYCFAWASPSGGDVDILLASEDLPDDDDFLERLAGFLYEHRHELDCDASEDSSI